MLVSLIGGFEVDTPGAVEVDRILVYFSTPQLSVALGQQVPQWTKLHSQREVTRLERYSRACLRPWTPSTRQTDGHSTRFEPCTGLSALPRDDVTCRAQCSAEHPISPNVSHLVPSRIEQASRAARTRTQSASHTLTLTGGSCIHSQVLTVLYCDRYAADASIACLNVVQRFNSLVHVYEMIGERRWDMQWKVSEKVAECLGCRRRPRSRDEPCFDNVLEDSLMKALSQTPHALRVAVARDARLCVWSDVCVYCCASC